MSDAVRRPPDALVPEAEDTEAQERLLAEVWTTPPGLRSASAVNQTYVGRRFLLTGLAYFLIAGVLGLLIRLQLALPGAELLSAETYNRIFTMHGTTMMFLFAVPVLEGAAVYLLPMMIGARDLPFPRLSAFGYWCYLFGGALLLSSLPLGLAPDSGWFNYPPLSSDLYSPGIDIDFWLLGITFVEISAISAAIELIVAVLKTRAPGMALHRMPLFAWYVLVTAFMILLAFPPLVAGSILLELERAFDMPFFDATRGGDPLLWQHLFWLFGHPEVYIILLPAAGILSMLVPTLSRRPIVGYGWFVLAAVATGFLSFGLWVHHMYTVGIPQLSLAFFSAASAMVAVPSGIQVFALIATIWHGRPVFRTPLLFFIGFVVIFVIGGFTGVMVAMVPFDMQVHDTQFVVAHFHYVLIGGMVFPLFGGIYYWLPLATGRLPSERLGKWNFWTMFVGFNLTFFPLHHTGLAGMPRRVYTYPEGLGWTWSNFTATVGAFVFASGVLLLFVNAVWSARRGKPAGDDPWGGGTLEWLHGRVPPYNFRSIPEVADRDPLWDRPELRQEVKAGEWYLADPLDGRRLTIGSTVASARPEQIVQLPGPTYVPLVAALFVGVFFVGFLTKYYWFSALGAVLALGAFVYWMWPEPPRDNPRTLPAGRGLQLPTDYGFHRSPAWSALLLTLVGDAALFASLAFSMFFLASFAFMWPPSGLTEPRWEYGAFGVGLLVPTSLALAWGQRGLRRGNQTALILGLLIALGLGSVFLLFQALTLAGLRAAPQIHAFSALSWTLVGYQAFHLFVGLVMAAIALGRAVAGHFASDRHVAVRILGAWWHYSVLLWLISALLIYPFSEAF